jgi:hypothetical protein
MNPFFFPPRARRFTAWTALLAVVLASLAPFISHAKAMHWAELCTQEGVRWVAVNAAYAEEKSPQNLPQLPCFQACAYCATHAGSFGLPPSVFVFVAPSNTPTASAKTLASPLRLPPWPGFSHHPRAPPLPLHAV